MLLRMLQLMTYRIHVKYKAGYSFKTNHTIWGPSINEVGFEETGNIQVPGLILDSSEHHNENNLAKPKIQSPPFPKIPEHFYETSTASAEAQNRTSVKVSRRMHRRNVLSPDYTETEGSASAEDLETVNGEDTISPNYSEIQSSTTAGVSENVNSEDIISPTYYGYQSFISVDAPEVENSEDIDSFNYTGPESYTPTQTSEDVNITTYNYYEDESFLSTITVDHMEDRNIDYSDYPEMESIYPHEDQKFLRSFKNDEKESKKNSDGEPEVLKRKPKEKKLYKMKGLIASKIIIKHIEETDRVYNVGRPDIVNRTNDGVTRVPKLKPQEMNPGIENKDLKSLVTPLSPPKLNEHGLGKSKNNFDKIKILPKQKSEKAQHKTDIKTRKKLKKLKKPHYKKGKKQDKLKALMFKKGGKQDKLKKLMPITEEKQNQLKDVMPKTKEKQDKLKNVTPITEEKQDKLKEATPKTRIQDKLKVLMSKIGEKEDKLKKLMSKAREQQDNLKEIVSKMGKKQYKLKKLMPKTEGKKDKFQMHKPKIEEKQDILKKPKSNEGKKKHKVSKTKQNIEEEIIATISSKSEPKIGRGKNLSTLSKSKYKIGKGKKKLKTGNAKKKLITEEGKKPPKPSKFKLKTDKRKNKPVKLKSTSIPRKNITGKPQGETVKEKTLPSGSIVEMKNSSILVKKIVEDNREGNSKMVNNLYQQDDEEPLPKTDLSSEVIAKTFEKLSPNDQRKALRYIISRLKELSMLNSLLVVKRTLTSSNDSLPETPNESSAYSEEIGITSIPENSHFSRKKLKDAVPNSSSSEEISKLKRAASADNILNAEEFMLQGETEKPSTSEGFWESDYITSSSNYPKNSELLLKDIITHLKKKVELPLPNFSTLPTDAVFGNLRGMKKYKRSNTTKLKRVASPYIIVPNGKTLINFERTLQDILSKLKTLTTYASPRNDRSTYKTFSDFKKVLHDAILIPGISPTFSQPYHYTSNAINIINPMALIKKTFSDLEERLKNLTLQQDTIPDRRTLHKSYFISTDRTLSYSRETFQNIMSISSRGKKLSDLKHLVSNERIPSHSGKAMNNLSNSRQENFLKPIKAIPINNTFKYIKNDSEDITLNPNQVGNVSNPVKATPTNRTVGNAEKTLLDIISNLSKLKEIFAQNGVVSNFNLFGDLASTFYNSSLILNDTKSFLGSSNVSTAKAVGDSEQNDVSTLNDSWKRLEVTSINPSEENTVSESDDASTDGSTDISGNTEQETLLTSEKVNSFSEYLVVIDKTTEHSGDTTPLDVISKKPKMFSKPINFLSTERYISDSSTPFRETVHNQKTLKKFSKTYPTISPERNFSHSIKNSKNKAPIFKKQKKLSHGDSTKNSKKAKSKPGRLQKFPKAYPDTSTEVVQYKITTNPKRPNKLLLPHNNVLTEKTVTVPRRR
ncbi:hypothetical protein TNCT_608681 [Trichonephila clavata]|uniref:Uncharacterized protein n=1 Tax=Trichonephila clavata TaxID=2740835 RepID=A0A8X6F2P7_TRICU|nr:hypothetical protein TNCT_608681 [Trichonephila clavata]